MGSRESSSNKASSDGPVPLCVAYTRRCLAKERRNGLGSARRTSRNPDAPRTQCHQEVWQSHRCRILIFPGPPHQTLQGQIPGASIRMWQLAQSGFARCISICSRKDNPSTCPSAVKPSTPGGSGGGGHQANWSTPTFLASLGWSAWGCWWPSRPRHAATNQAIRLEVLTRRYLPEGMDRNP